MGVPGYPAVTIFAAMVYPDFFDPGMARRLKPFVMSEFCAAVIAVGAGRNDRNLRHAFLPAAYLLVKPYKPVRINGPGLFNVIDKCFYVHISCPVIVCYRT